MAELLIDQALSPELDRDVHFGPAEGHGVVDADGFSVRIADQPVAIPLRTLYLRAGLPFDSPLLSRFDVWLIPHRLSVIRRSGLAEPTAIGLEVEYNGDGATCSVLALLPSAEFTTYGGIAGNFNLRGQFSPSGEAEPLDVPSQAKLSDVMVGPFRVGADAGVKLNFEFAASVATPRVSAVGIGSSRCEWRFDRYKEPLFGKDVETWAAIILPKRKRSLSHRIRFYMLSRTFVISTRRESNWLQLTCDLPTE
jgi:hypothetical protein